MKKYYTTLIVCVKESMSSFYDLLTEPFVSPPFEGGTGGSSLKGNDLIKRITRKRYTQR
jgi:hypothetical protein